MPTANQRVSEYVLEQRLGGGTFGEVWRAHHHVWTDQMVAIKIPTDSQYVRNLQQEGAAIHGLVHPNIVRAIGFDPYADPPYLTMEYVPGSSLRPVIQAKQADVQQAVAIVKQVLAGLSYAHKNNVIHRDVKPENILVHERTAKEGFGVEGLVKVADFGLGKAANKMVGTGSIMYSQDMSMESGKIAGTLDYMAPEQRTGGDLDARADLYAVGVILYELLTGERPTGTEVPSELNPQVPKYLDDVFRKSYTRLDKRFASADDFSKALTTAAPPPLPVGQAPRPPGLTPPPFLGNTGRPLGNMPPMSHAPTPSGSFGSGPIMDFFRPIVDGGRLVCVKCRRAVKPTDNFCLYCGVKMVPVVRNCNKCGKVAEYNDQFCQTCGDKLPSVMAGAK